MKILCAVLLALVVAAPLSAIAADKLTLIYVSATN
jgi:hypothetical protein